MADRNELLLGVMQAAQVRKSSYVADLGVEYNPDSYHAHTIHAGTIVLQVRTDPRLCCPCL